MAEGVWRKGKPVRTGSWEYQWASNTFHVHLDKPVAWADGTSRRLVLLGHETPEWGQWRLDR